MSVRAALAGLGLAAALLLSACTTGTDGVRIIPDAPEPGGSTRTLTNAERAVIARDVSAAVGVPANRLAFFWPRAVRAERAGITDYCGFYRRLGADESGEYVAFYAQLAKNRRGRVDRAELRLSSAGLIQGLATRRACLELGYDVSRPPAR